VKKTFAYRLSHSVWRRLYAWRRKTFVRGILAWRNNYTREILAMFEKAAGRAGTLTLDEERSYVDFWRKYGIEVPPTYYRLLKLFLGKTPSPQYVPGEVFFAHILPAIAPVEDARVFQDKSMYGFYFRDMRRPYEPLRCVDGVCYGADNAMMPREAAVAAVLAYGRPLICKPTIDTGEGKSIQLLQSYDRSRIEALFKEYAGNFALQEVVRQSAQTAAFNESSLNTFRVLTLYLNGRYSVLSSTMRVGGVGSVVDNVGAGGFLLGVSSDGTLTDWGLDHNGNRVTETVDGRSLAGRRITSFDRVLAFVEKLHRRLPYVPVVGWDVALDEHGEPVLIEINATQPDTQFVQLHSGPLFGDRFDEVMACVADAQARERNVRRIAAFRPDSKFPPVCLWPPAVKKTILGRLLVRLYRGSEKVYRCAFVRHWVRLIDARQRGILAAFEEVNGGVSVLSTAERASLRRFWEPYGIHPGDTYYRLLKIYPGIAPDPHYIPDEIEYMHLLPAVNPIEDCRVLQDKSVYGFYFHDVRRPKEPLRCIRGLCYDDANNFLERDEAVARLVAFGGPVIVKPTVDSGRGKNVRILRKYDAETVNALFREYDGNFTVQELVAQSAQTAVFNPSSLNTFRITSIFLNGRFSVSSSVFRFGGAGSEVDNICAGGFMTGVHPDGTLFARGHDTAGHTTEVTQDGRRLADCRIEAFPKVLAFVEKLHTRLPYIAIAGWDVALDAADEPVFIEFNAASFGIDNEQYYYGPLLGDRFDEVMERVKTNRYDRSRVRCGGEWRVDSQFPRAAT